MFGAQSSLDTVVPLSELRRYVQSRYPVYQFNEPVVIPKPRKPEFGYLCQAQPDKQANLPAIRHTEVKDRQGKCLGPFLELSLSPKLPPLRASRYVPSFTPFLLKQSALRPESKPKPDAVQLSSSRFSQFLLHRR